MGTQIISSSPNDLPDITKLLLEKHPDKKIFAFYGQMGAGKTTFIREFCKALKVMDNVSSPTFAIINEYQTSEKYNVYHFDFYRINKLAEAIDIGTEEYFYSNDYCLIEWPELVEEILPENSIAVSIVIDSENENRIFTF